MADMIWYAEKVMLYTYGRGEIYHETVSFKTLKDALKAFYNRSLGGKNSPIKLYGTGKNVKKTVTLRTNNSLDMAVYDGSKLIGYVTPSGDIISRKGEPFTIMYKEYGKRTPIVIEKMTADRISKVRNHIIRSGMAERYGDVRIYHSTGLIGEVGYTGSPKETVMGGLYVWHSPNPKYPYRVLTGDLKPIRWPMDGTKPTEWRLK